MRKQDTSNSLFAFLGEGEQNAKTARQLMQSLGYNSVREVAADIARLRKRKNIICSVTDANVKGYYLPANRSDVERFVRKTRSRIRETEKMLKPAEDFLEGGGM